MTASKNAQSPEQGYPYHPQAWREIGALSVAALADIKPADGEDFVAYRWRVNMYGFACRLERPVGDPNKDTVYAFGFEDDAVGRHFNKVPFISAGLRRPVAVNPRKYGILRYSQAQGLVKEPEGDYPNDYIRTIGKVDNISDPEKRIVGFEKLLTTLLSYVPRGWEQPISLPSYKKW